MITTGKNSTYLVAGLLALGFVVGCDGPQAKFRRYTTFAALAKGADGGDFKQDQWQNLDETLEGLFGTPDQPKLPAATDINTILDVKKLTLAAGPVHTDRNGVGYGLYREHCAHCHGVTGDGNGPTAAFLNPYPRDYRRGIYKFKSTPIGEKPTHEDLTQILLNGIPGTAMPSFKLLLESEVEALVQYVKYLSIRGEVERKLIDFAANELDADKNEMLLSVSLKQEKPEAFKARAGEIMQMVNDVTASWIRAPEAVPPVTPRPAMTDEELATSIGRGRKLFYGTLANCVKCHGDSALGDGQTDSLDSWLGEFVDPNKPDYQKNVRKFVSLGMPEPRTIRPRNLRQGVFRGGLRPIDIHLRIRNGIEGSPMPGLKLEEVSSAKALTESDVWDLVNYVQSLPYEPLSAPPIAEGALPAGRF